jgi:hypothetical protein
MDVKTYLAEFFEPFACIGGCDCHDIGRFSGCGNRISRCFCLVYQS